MQVSFKVVGDLMLGHSFSTYWKKGIGLKFKQNEYFKGLPPALEEGILFGNLECIPMSDSDFFKKPMATNINVFPFLKKMGFKVLSLANNHILDYGFHDVDMLSDSMVKSGIAHSGFGDSADIPTVVKVKNISIGFLSFCLIQDPGSNNVKDEAEILRLIRLNKDKQDFLFVSIHWGSEFMSFPSKSQCVFAEKIIDAGADGIIGHHPHILQHISWYKGKPIIFSLGNFISDMYEGLSRIGGLFEFVIIDDVIGGKIYPIWIDDYFRPNLIDDEYYDIIKKRVSMNIGKERRSYFLKNITSMDISFIRRQFKRRFSK